MATLVGAKTHLAIAAGAAALVAVVAWWSAGGRGGATAARQEPEQVAAPGDEPRRTGADSTPNEEEEHAASTRTAAPAPPQAKPVPRAWPPPAYEYELEVLVTDERDLPFAGRTIHAAPAGGTLNRIGDTDSDGRLVVRFKAFASWLELDVALRGESVPLRRVALSPGRTRLAVRALSSGGAAPLRMTLARAEDSGADGAIQLDSGTFQLVVALAPALELDRAPQALTGAEGWLTFVEPQLVRLVPPVQPASPEASEVLWLSGEARLFTQLQRTQLHLNQIQFDAAPHLEAALFRSLVIRELIAEPPPPLDIVGRVLAASGQPIEGVPVFARRPGTSWAETTSDAEGRFAFLAIEPGEWELRAGGGRMGRASALMSGLPGEQRTWEARLDRGIELKLRLVDTEGRPLAGWRVEIGDDAIDPCADGTVTDAEGRATIPNVPYWAVRVLARPDDGSGAPPMTIAGAVLGGEEELVFRIDPAATQSTGSLRVELSAREPTLDGAEVRIWRDDCGRGSYLAPCGMTSLPEGGGRHDFDIGGLLAGSYRAEILVPGHAPLAVSAIYVAPGEPVKVSLELAPGASVEVAGPEHEAWTWSLLHRAGAFEVTSSPAEVTSGATLAVRPGLYDQGELRAGERWTLDPSGLRAQSAGER